MVTSEAMQEVVGYMQKFLSVVTPIAKQAYEMGLTTLRIEAAQNLFYGMLAVLVIAIYARAMKTKILPAVRNAEPWKEDGPICAMVLSSCVAVLCAWVAFGSLLDIWNWVQLIRPELWLAHEAITKVMR